MPENDKKKKQQNLWSWVIRKYPNLATQYGDQVPLDDNGLIPRYIAEAIKTEERASKPQVGPGGVYPGQRQLPAPQPVNWAEVGRDITSGIANIGTIPLLGKGQGTVENLASRAFGVEPRSFDVPEDGGMIRKIADPIMPTLSGIGTVAERFLDPSAAVTFQAIGRSMGSDPYGAVSHAEALRDAGYGPLESQTTPWHEGEIPWQVKLPLEVATSPEELIPGWGVYAGLGSALGRRVGKTAAGEVAEEVVEEAAPVVARQVEEPVVARQAGEVDPRLEKAALETSVRKDPATQATIGAVGPTGEPPKTIFEQGVPRIETQVPSIDESFLIPETLPISAREMGPAERVIPETEKVSAIDGIKNILDQDVPTRTETIPSVGEPFMSDVVGQTLEELGTIIDKGGTQKAIVLRNLDAALNKASSVTNELVDGIDEVRSGINQYFTTGGTGSRATKQRIFDGIQNQVRDLSPRVQPAALPEQAIPSIDRTTLSTAERIGLLRDSENPIVKELIRILDDTVGSGFREYGRAIDMFDLGIDLGRRESRQLTEALVSLQGTRSRTTGELTGEVIRKVPMRIRDQREIGGTRSTQGWQVSNLPEFINKLEEIDITPSSVRDKALQQEVPINRASRLDLPEQYFDEAGELIDEATVTSRYIEPLIDIVSVDRPARGWASVIRKLERQIERTEDIDIVEGLDDIVDRIEEFRDMEREGMSAVDFREAKDQAFTEIMSSVDDLIPSSQFTEVLEEAEEINRLLAEAPEPTVRAIPEATEEVIDSIPTYRANVVQDLSRAISENPLLYREDIISGSDALRDSVNNYIQGSNIDQLPVETATTLFGREGFNADTAFNRIEEAINNLGTVADEVPVEEVARRTPIDQTPTGVPSIMGTAAVKAIELPESQVFTFKDPMTMEQHLSSGLKRSKQGEESVAAVKQDGYPVSDAAPVTEAARSYKNQLIQNTNDIAQAIRDMVPADIMSKAVFKPASWLTDRMGKQLITKYEGALNGELARIQDFVINGARGLERLGLGTRQRGVTYGTERAFLLTADDWGTAGAEGPIKVLYQALHGENNGVNRWLSGDGMAHPAMAPDKRALREEILSDLKSATDYEESMRIDFDPNVATVKDYFYRGWKPVDEEKIRNNMSRLAANPSYLKSRSTLSFTEMMDIGFEPLFRDPFQQAAFAQQMGTKYRLQTELADLLQNPKLELAHYVESKEALTELKEKYGVSFRVPEVGPAFEGKGFMIVDESGIGGRQEIAGTVSTPVDGQGTKYIMKAGQIAVPAPVADSLESIFRGGATSWQKAFSQKIPFKKDPVPINITKIIDGLVFIPKRLKLFGSLFQATDFMRRIGVGGTHGAISAIWDGIERGMTPGQAFDMGRVALEARGSLASVGRGWWEIVSSYGAAGKTDYYRNLLRTGKEAKEGIIKGAPIIEGTDFYWSDMVKNGLNVRDLTILPGEDVARLVGEVASNANFPRKMGRLIKELEYSSRRGLFDRVYPAAIMTDVKYNLLPMAMRSYPHATPDAIMALVARQANLKYSTLLRSQSNLNSFFRETLSRIMFSVNENEGLIRQLTRAFRGEETKFWRQYWISAAVFFAFTANVIHGASTLVTGDGLQPLPTERYNPIRTNRKGWWNYGYNSRFLNPDLPITSRSGERAMIDMLGQLDTAGRMFDFQEFPLDSFITSRKGATAGALHHLFTGKDFYGRETDKFGWTGRGLQFMYDIAAPIGVGEAGVGLAREAFGEQELPSMGPLLAPGARVKDVLPVAEPALGLGGMLAEMSGENIKAPTVGQLQRRMILNVYPDSDASTFKDLDADKVLEVERHRDNEQIRNEIKQRSIEGAEMDNAWNEQRVERDEVKASRKVFEEDLINKYMFRADVWEPSDFRNELKEINLKSRVRQEMLTLKYGEDPFMKKSMEESMNISDEELEKMRIETPIKWAWNRYLRLLNEETPPGEFKDIDYDAFNIKLSKEQETWGEELIDRFDAYRASKSLEDHADEVNEYYDAMGILEEGNWYDNPSITQLVMTYHERMPKRKDGTGLLEEWNRWQSSGSKERSLIETHGAYRDTIKIIKARKAALRNLLRMQGVTLKSGEFVSGVKVDQILIKWFGSSPAHRENIVFYTNLYGKPPKRMAS